MFDEHGQLAIPVFIPNNEHAPSVSQVEKGLKLSGINHESPLFIQTFKETLGFHFNLSIGLIFFLIMTVLILSANKIKYNPIYISILFFGITIILYVDAYRKTNGKVFDEHDVELIKKSFNPLEHGWHSVKHFLWFGLTFLTGLTLGHGGLTPWLILPLVGLGIFTIIYKNEIAYHGTEKPEDIEFDLTDSFGTHEGLMYHFTLFGLMLLVGYFIGSKV